jgi:acetyl esterase
VYLHGGGWVIGDLETHDRACRRLAAGAGVAVLALDYRRAPEHPWPAAVDDAVAVLRWIAEQPPELEPAPGAVAIAGDSAGGTIAALACVRIRDEAPEALPRVQVLIYANTDLGNSGASMVEKGHGFGLDVADVEWFSSQWVPDPAMRTDPRVSPLFVRDLSGLPAAVVITNEHDPLRDQGEAYATRLRQAGVPVKARCEPGMIHNFMLFDLISPACAAASDRVAADVKAALSSGAGRSEAR